MNGKRRTIVRIVERLGGNNIPAWGSKTSKVSTRTFLVLTDPNMQRTREIVRDANVLRQGRKTR